jgi:hypothetical protein
MRAPGSGAALQQFAATRVPLRPRGEVLAGSPPTQFIEVPEDRGILPQSGQSLEQQRGLAARAEYPRRKFAAAVLFGLGHLGAVAAELPLTTPLVMRTVALNAAGGIVFGWLS